ncbi:MAG: hypothetical protein JW902_02195 [Syntrophaceae bacterium]|nr:hypothetical protein [Syntrophaceae bacterium]
MIQAMPAPFHDSVRLRSFLMPIQFEAGLWGSDHCIKKESNPEEADILKEHED